MNITSKCALHKSALMVDETHLLPMPYSMNLYLSSRDTSLTTLNCMGRKEGSERTHLNSALYLVSSERERLTKSASAKSVLKLGCFPSILQPFLLYYRLKGTHITHSEISFAWSMWPGPPKLFNIPYLNNVRCPHELSGKHNYSHKNAYKKAA